MTPLHYQGFGSVAKPLLPKHTYTYQGGSNLDACRREVLRRA